jgi:DNA repair protein RecO (recombination protein O)
MFLCKVFTSRAISIRATPFSDSSMVCLFFTETHGPLSFLIPSVRKAKAKITTAMLQPLARMEITFSFKKTGSLHRVNELVPLPSAWDFHPEHGVSRLFLSEILSRSIRDELQDSPLFHYVWKLMEEAPFDEIALQTAAKLTEFLGFIPDLDTYEPGSRWDLREGRFSKDILHPYYLQEGLSAVLIRWFLGERDLKITADERSRMFQAIMDYYRLHLPGFSEPKSAALLLSF